MTKEIENLLQRGVEEIIDKKHLEEQLASGKKLRIKLGIDPTSPNIHLGRSIPLLKLRDFQDAGHQIVFIVGDFTGTVGDTSDKESERPMLTEAAVAENLKTYIEQAGKVIDIKKAEIVYNKEWLSKLTYGEIGKHADIFSLSDFISRENIKKRLDAGKRVSLRELLYPLMQGYDSVAVKSDVEVGGTDQRFNILAGRDMQRAYGQEPQDIILGPLIEGLDGRKMSSSWGNTVNLSDEPTDMYGKIMSLKDEFIIKYFIYLTRVDMKTVQEYEESMKNGSNPKEIKMKLAFELVRMYHGDESAEKAQEYFTKAFSQKEIPDEIQTTVVDSGEQLSKILIDSAVVASMTEFKRLVNEGAIATAEGMKIEDFNFPITESVTVKVGKRRFLKISVK